MKKYIGYHWAAGGVKEFDTKTGKVKNAPDKEWGTIGFYGSIWKQNGKYFAFYRNHESQILQYKKNIWRVDLEHTTTLRGFFIFRNFKIFRNNKSIFSIWYIPRGLFMSLIDPTYDRIEAETDDFFLYVKNTWETERAKQKP